MKRFQFLALTLILWGVPTRPALGYIDVSPTLGRLLKDATSVALVEVEQVSRERGVIIFRKIADLKGRDFPARVKHHIAGGFHPREPASILDWAAPGRRAIVFCAGRVCQVCLGRYWYECSLRQPSWWGLTCGQAQLCFAYCGSIERLRHHVLDILAGREVVITAVKYGADDDYWTACKRVVARRQVPRGPDFPIWRYRASLDMPNSLFDLAREPKYAVGPGACGPEGVPALVAALSNPDWRLRLEAAEDLGTLGAAGRDGARALAAALHDPEARVRLGAAEALAKIKPSNPEAVAVLVGLLRGETGAVRKAAAEALGERGADTGGAVLALSQALADPDPGVRWAAAEALTRFGPKAAPAIAALTRALESPPTMVRSAAADSLGAIGPPAREAVPRLVHLLEDADPTLRWAAAGALMRIDRLAARAAVPLFILALEGHESRARWHALAYLLRLDPEASAAVPLPLLTEALRDPDIGVRARAARLLGKLGPRAAAAAPALTEALRDSDSWVRSVAGPALVLILGRKATAAVPALVEALGDEDPDTRSDSLAALRILGPAGREALPGLYRALQREEGTSRLEAAEAVWRVNRDAGLVLPVLRDGLGDLSPDIRRRALRVVGRIGPEARPLLAALGPLLEDKDPGVQQEAAAALAKIEGRPANRVREQDEDRSGSGRKLALWALLGVSAGLPLWARTRAGRGTTGPAPAAGILFAASEDFNSLKGGSTMAEDKKDQTKEQKEGHGLVPNVTSEEPQGKTEELKKALHELEEEKGDWAQDR